MRAIAAVVALSGCATSSSATSLPTPAPVAIPAELTPVDRVGDPSLAATMDLVAADLPAWWAEALPRLSGDAWTPGPNLRPVLPSATPVLDCAGWAWATRGQATYCGPDDLVAWDAELLVPHLYDRFGPLGAAFVLAHEVAHAAQARGDLRAVGVRDRELQADCLAGAWWAERAPALLGPGAGDVDTAVRRAPALFGLLGDPVHHDVDPAMVHGLSGERTAAFRRGLDQGPAACLTG